VECIEQRRMEFILRKCCILGKSRVHLREDNVVYLVKFSGVYLEKEWSVLEKWSVFRKRVECI